tara:strand:+ start:2734 stop:2916 length:183 start_codon:yes stop_codon:yes gene_type:complete
MNLNVTIKSVYGNDNVYPACDASKLFAAIAGTKTLSYSSRHLLRRAGYVLLDQAGNPVTI